MGSQYRLVKKDQTNPEQCVTKRTLDRLDLMAEERRSERTRRGEYQYD
jgi:hypothetical protein